MSSTHKAAVLAVAPLLLWIGMATRARAEIIVVGARVVVAESSVPRPAGGMTMAAVEARFGAPLVRHRTVGKPPITRWDYAQFAVFFEKNRVIDAVVPGPVVATAARSGAAAESKALPASKAAPASRTAPASQAVPASATVGNDTAASGAPAVPSAAPAAPSAAASGTS